MRVLSRLAVKRPLSMYYILAITISTVIWTPLVLSHTEGDATSGRFWWLHYLGGLGPALAAFIMSYASEGKVGIKYLLQKLRLTRDSVFWTLLGAFLPLLLLLLVIIIVGIFKGNWIVLSDITQTAKLPGVGLFGILLFEILFFGFGEEMGWRGYVWPLLRKKHNFILSTILVTLPWVLWHTVTFIYNDNMLNLGLGGTFGWIFSLFTGAIILGWLTDSAKGNILPVILFHGVLDVVFVSKAVANVYDSYLGAAVMFCSCVVLAVSHIHKVDPKYNKHK